jgi:hypothetical protein
MSSRSSSCWFVVAVGLLGAVVACGGRPPEESLGQAHQAVVYDADDRYNYYEVTPGEQAIMNSVALVADTDALSTVGGVEYLDTQLSGLCIGQKFFEEARSDKVGQSNPRGCGFRRQREVDVPSLNWPWSRPAWRQLILIRRSASKREVVCFRGVAEGRF